MPDRPQRTPSEPAVRWPAWSGPALLLAAHLALLARFDLAAHPWFTVVALGVGFAGLALVCSGRTGAALGGREILIGAVILRGLLLPLPATLSDDVLRYVWDGQVAVAGSNPYALAPEAEELVPLRDERWERMSHRDVEAVYPPLALLCFSIAALLPWPVLGWKLLLVAIELVGCALLLRLAVRLDLDARRVALYAWNPLVTLEVAGMGHLDAVGVTLVIIVVSTLSGRPTRAAVAAGAAVLAKLVPVLLIPLWMQRAVRPRRFVAVALAMMALGLVPMLVATGGVPPGWVRYGVSWEFNGPVYEPLWRAIEAIELDSVVKDLCDRLERWTGRHHLLEAVYPYVYPQLMAKAVLGALLLLLWWRLWGDRHASLASVTGRGFGLLLLCSATVYPWYLLWVLPWAALAGHSAWIALSGLILLSYIPQYTDVALLPWVFLAIWVPFGWLLSRNRSWSTL